MINDTESFTFKENIDSGNAFYIAEEALKDPVFGINFMEKVRQHLLNSTDNKKVLITKC
jgi:hypothetical protein